MEKIVIEGRDNRSAILVGESIENLKKYIPDSGVFIITDENVDKFHGKSFPDFPVYVIEPGEPSKDFPVVAKIYRWLLDEGADRSSFIVGIGGGVVCDIAGFVAATFMRGIPFGFVASSLLAQVDASVGGKNGVNLEGYKNIVGTFSQPDFVICDTAMLHTLAENEFRNGMAEVIKHALIKDADKFTYLQTHRHALLNLQPDALNTIVSQSVKIKAAIVQADEREQGIRRLLNFGHTWGHAIEKVSKIPHGQAVAIGMVFAAGYSVHQGYLKNEEYQKILNILEDYGLPVLAQIDNNKVFEAMLKDKKRDRQNMHFILLESIGKAFVKETDIEALKSFAL
ncbi:MAG: 3-dehydroquinate synthase [Bacteroidetes bacterium]|nr:MAG: 3-dehydroquinate synthase [Bacteroidota bacterium]